MATTEAVQASRGELNKQVVRRYVEAYNDGDFQFITHELCWADAMFHGIMGSTKLKDVVPVWNELRAAFAKHLEIEELIADGDTVCARMTETGYWQGSFHGEPPTGKPYKVIALEWFRMRDGKIAERFGMRDSVSILRQVGLSLE